MQHILIVDDNPAILSLLQQALEAEGYACTPAHGGQEALALFEANTFHAVVLDLMMPDLDWLSVCRTLRRYSNVPILMLTARTEEKDCIEGFDVGADDYVTKPFSTR